MFHLGDIKRVDNTTYSGIKSNSEHSGKNRGAGGNQTFRHHGKEWKKRKDHSQGQQKAWGSSVVLSQFDSYISTHNTEYKLHFSHLFSLHEKGFIQLSKF